MTIDLHSHILPGVDDGPESLDGALALARAYVELETTRVVATPHVNARWRQEGDAVLEAYRYLCSGMADEGIDLKLELGGEVSMATALDLDADDLYRFRLGGGDWLLIEPPSRAPSFGIRSMLFGLQSRGHKLLLAHPERCQTFQDDLEYLEDLVDGGIRTQVTASALSGRFGTTAEQAAKEMFRRKLVHTVASDAHDAFNRPPGLVDDLKIAGLGDLVQWLCFDMPNWILDGGDEPERPNPVGCEGPKKSRWTLRRSSRRG